MTSRARELPYSEDDRRELAKRYGVVKRLVREWRSRRLQADGFPDYLVEMTAATERLFQWMDELWLYGSGGRQAFDREIEAEDAADPATLSPAQIERRHNRERWSRAAKLAERLVGEARAEGESDEAQRLERAFVRTVLAWLPPELTDKNAMLNRAALISMLRGDRPKVLIAVSLDDYPEFANPNVLLKVVPGDDPLHFPPATSHSKRIGLFADPSVDCLNGRVYPRIEAPGSEPQR